MSELFIGYPVKISMAGETYHVRVVSNLRKAAYGLDFNIDNPKALLALFDAMLEKRSVTIQTDRADMIDGHNYQLFGVFSIDHVSERPMMGASQ